MNLLLRRWGWLRMRMRELVDKIDEDTALHAGVAVASRLLLVGENRDHGVLAFGLEHCGERGISAYEIVVSVCTDHGAVKSYINCVSAGTRQSSAEMKSSSQMPYFSLRRAMAFSLTASFSEPSAGVCEIRTLSPSPVNAWLLLILLLCEVGKKIGNAEYGIAGLVAELDVYACSVGTDDNAVERKRMVAH